MTLFSQRKGFKPLRKTIQREVADDELRSRLWSALKVLVWDKWGYPNRLGRYDQESRLVNQLVDCYWLHLFKQPLDVRPHFKNATDGETAYTILRKYFFSCKWYEMYDFIEFTLKNCPTSWANALRSTMNSLLQDENAAYRIVGSEVAEITDEEEIAAIEEAIGQPHDPASEHVQAALRLLTDRQNRDYRNSIKESISAVEAICQRICGDSKATLADAIKKMKSRSQVHPAFEKGLSALYGYTSDAGGIRHALTDEAEIPTYADAKFMLVACSGFVNYLLAKSAELRLEMGTS